MLFGVAFVFCLSFFLLLLTVGIKFLNCCVVLYGVFFDLEQCKVLCVYMFVYFILHFMIFVNALFLCHRWFEERKAQKKLVEYHECTSRDFPYTIRILFSLNSRV